MASNFVITGKGIIKLDYNKQERDQLQSYIKDLETTIGINKQINKEMISGMSDNVKAKRIIDNLTKENALLTSQNKKIIKERDDAQYKALINGQLSDNYRQKEKELFNECQEKIQELQEQLNKKEYMLQKLEKKYSEAEKLLRKYAKNDAEIKKMIESKCISEKGCISNVVIENEHLKNDLSQIIYERERMKLEIQGYKEKLCRKGSDFTESKVPKLSLDKLQKSLIENKTNLFSPQRRKETTEIFARSITPRPELKTRKDAEENQGALNDDQKNLPEQHSITISSISNENQNSIMQNELDIDKIDIDVYALKNKW